MILRTRNRRRERTPPLLPVPNDASAPLAAVAGTEALPPFLTKREVAARLRCSPRTIERLISRQCFVPADHEVARVLIPREQVLLYEARMRAVAACRELS